MKKTSIIVTLLLASSSVFAQQKYWKEISQRNKLSTNLVNRSSTPKEYKLFNLNVDNLLNDLNNVKSRSAAQIVNIPDENGKITKYEVNEASIMAPELQEKYNQIKSYVGKSLDGKSSIRFSYSPYHGFSAMIFTAQSTSYIDAYTNDLKTYITYNRKNVENNLNFACHTNDDKQNELIDQAISSIPANKTVTDGKMRKYRLALATTLEYSRYHVNRAGGQSGTVEERKAIVMSAINVAMTRVNGVYEKEFGVTMELVSNNDQIIFVTTDEYTNNSGSAMLGENQTVLDRVIGTENYDIGHVFSTGGGGVAYLKSPCSTIKAGGVTGLGAPINDAFYIDYVAHEMGHQFGGNHTFNGTKGSCAGGNKNTATSVEPGSGSTIMAYAGICTPENVQLHSDPYFSSVTVNEIYNFIKSTAGSCSVNTDSGNNEPLITLDKLTYTVPNSTAFVLEANASDQDGDALTYNWEQIDTSSTSLLPMSTNKTGVLFRSYNPTTDNFRYFPNLNAILQNKLILDTNIEPLTWEVIPSVNRALKFSLLVRDNNPKGGQTDRKNVQLNVIAEAGPFKVTSQTANEVWTYNNPATITWDVAGTDANGVNTTNVKVLLSTDGGQKFDYILAESIQNNGAYTFNVPSDIKLTKEARFMIKAIDNVFLAVNASNFEISDKLATNDVNKNELFTISPNPSKGIVQLNFAKTVANATITITDLAGRTVYTSKLNSSKNKQLNVEQLGNGVYIVSVEADQQQYTKKLIIKK